MSFVARNLARTTVKRSIPRATALSASWGSKVVLGARQTPFVQRAAFSMTSSKLSAGIAEPAPARAYDDEVADMAKYIHNYDVKSDLAVCPSNETTTRTNAYTNVDRHRPLCLPRHSWLRSQSSRVSPLHQAPWSRCPRHDCAQWISCAWHTIRR